ncbi:hypothetical protein BU25DRAFT_460294 [Macroventuria anomochaeta]|uniref:Uncharacterized protein n=1 Tax=Macroventuria anomochaeta TaxID=301207 RepID=A0ACB6RUL3_9PLEO|nr:uncharacterized protein BU25DRAFT_460294 [Macroventuria anomochaeta]KAF2625576.1 hypothetical protein BU25DRAFT_460294 [Macroventuria anomochaeta]
MAKLIVIIGTTRNQGGSVAEAFLADKKWRLRIISRTPLKPPHENGPPAALLASSLSDPAVRAEAGKRGISPEERCAEIGIQCGKNLALAARTPDVQKTLERYVYSSLGNHSKLSGGRYIQTWHCDSKAAVERYGRDDPVLGPRSSFIRFGL